MIDLLRRGFALSLHDESLVTSLRRHTRPGTNGLTALADKLGPLLATMIDALEFAVRASKDAHGGRTIAFANAQILHYLLDARDLLPEAEFGMIGLLAMRFSSIITLSFLHGAGGSLMVSARTCHR